MGYREPKARLHNQTKNVKINPSPPRGGALVSYLGIRGENVSKAVASNENENQEPNRVGFALGSIADDTVWVAQHTTEW